MGGLNREYEKFTFANCGCSHQIDPHMRIVYSNHQKDRRRIGKLFSGW